MNTFKSKGIAFAALLILATAGWGFSQQPAQNRIPQQIVINGQSANGAYVHVPGGGMQSFTCSNPQQFVTADGGTQGWACYDAATSVWLLNAVPPVAAQGPVPQAVQQAPGVIYQQQPPVVYQQSPTVVYQRAPTVIYQEPAVVYAAPVYPYVVGGYYSPGVVLGASAINAAGRIVSAALIGSRYPRYYYPTRAYYSPRVYAPVRGRRR